MIIVLVAISRTKVWGLGSQAPENEGPGAVNGAMHFSQPRHQRNVHPGRLCRLESRA